MELYLLNLEVPAIDSLGLAGTRREPIPEKRGRPSMGAQLGFLPHMVPASPKESIA